jgi:AcrR family transcriptional regulator
MAADKLETEIRQEQITTAALGLIAAKGVSEFNMAKLAERVGLVPSAIYRHFKSKDEVLDATISHIRELLMENAQAARNATSDPIDRLYNLLKLHAELVRRNRGILHIVFSDSVYSGHPRRKQRMFQAVATYLSLVAEIITEGQAEGAICGNADAQTLAVMFLGLIQPAAFLSHMSNGKFDVTEHAEDAWKLFHKCLTSSERS